MTDECGDRHRGSAAQHDTQSRSSHRSPSQVTAERPEGPETHERDERDEGHPMRSRRDEERGDREERERREAGGGYDRGLEGSGAHALVEPELVAQVARESVVGTEPFGDFAREFGLEPALLIDVGQLPELAGWVAGELVLLALDVGIFGVTLRADREVFSRRHRQRARHETREPGDDGRVCGRRSCNDSKDEARGRHYAIVGAQNRRTQPRTAFTSVAFAMSSCVSAHVLRARLLHGHRPKSRPRRGGHKTEEHNEHDG